MRGWVRPGGGRAGIRPAADDAHRAGRPGPDRGPDRGEVAGPDPTGGGELPDLGPPGRSGPDRRPRGHQGHRGRRERGAGRGGPRSGNGHRRGRDRGPGRGLGRPVPRRRVPDGLGHLHQHEHERGAGHPRHGGDRNDGAPQRPGQRLPVVQRRDPLRHPDRRRHRHRGTAHPGAVPPGRVAAPPAGPAHGHGQAGPHPPHGRGPHHTRPGVRRVRHRDGARHGPPARHAAPALRPPARRDGGGDRAQRPRRVRTGGDPPPGPGVAPPPGGGSRPLRGPGSPGRVGGGEWRVPGGGRRPQQGGHRPAVDVLRTGRGAGRDPPSRPPARQLDHAGQGEPRPARGGAPGGGPGGGQRRRRRLRRGRRHLRAQRHAARPRPQPAGVHPAPGLRQPPAGRPLRGRHHRGGAGDGPPCRVLRRAGHGTGAAGGLRRGGQAGQAGRCGATDHP